LRIAPSHVISVAEVLEDSDREAVRAAFGVPTHQLYQATEGFLGYTCEHGTLHLNESFVHIEPDWLDAPTPASSPSSPTSPGRPS
jgi:phenylacetate-coenzyme A ligase PaaK-like adenylate-forming protein